MKCFWILGHDWSKWGDALRDYTGDRVQVRYCKKCNLQQKRKSYWANQLTDKELVASMKKDKE